MATVSKPAKATIWIWPTGLYPRRIIYYLKAKRLPLSTLNNLTLIPVSMTPAKDGLLPPPGSPPRPEGTSLPCLRFDDTNQLILQSSSILTYLEDVHGATLLGNGPIQRAHVNDIVQLTNEALMWTNVYLRHWSPMSRMWTGMTEEEQVASAAADALKQWKTCMAKLESWVRDDVVGRNSKGIAGGDGPTVADFSLMACRTYLYEMYQWDVFEGCEVLNEWFERAKGCEWYMDPEEIGRIEKEGFEELFV